MLTVSREYIESSDVLDRIDALIGTEALSGADIEAPPTAA
jgi:hypothetical protein